MEDESWRSTHGACPPQTRAGLFLSQPDPSLAQSGLFIINASPCHTQTGSSDSQAGPSHTQTGLSGTQAGSSPTQAGSPDNQIESTFDDDICPRELDRYIDLTSSFSDECPSHTQADPFLTQSNPSLTQAGPSHTQAGPSYTQAGSSNTKPENFNPQNMLKFPFDDDFCPRELDCYDSTSACSDLEFSFDDVLFPELDSPIDVTTPLTDAGPSAVRPDQECSPSFTQSRTSPTRTGTSKIQAGSNQTQRRPSHTQEMNKFKTKVYPCIYCQKVFVRKGNLRHHMYEVHGAELESTVFECNLCEKCFIGNDDLQSHIKKDHSSRKPDNQCSKCGMTFITSLSLTRHGQYFCPALSELSEPPATDEPVAVDVDVDTTKMGTKDTKCIFCKKVFSSRSNLNRHIYTVHEVNPILFMCDYCGKRFLRSDKFQRHLRTQHPNSKPDYKCSKCGMPFTTIRSRTRHIRFACPSLRKRPVSAEDDSASLTRIVEPGTSTGRSEQPSNLDKGCKRYVCSSCGRRYISKKSLLEHLRHRCGVPPRFSCSLCSYKAHYKQNLKHHMLSKHGSELPQQRLL